MLLLRRLPITSRLDSKSQGFGWKQVYILGKVMRNRDGLLKIGVLLGRHHDDFSVDIFAELFLAKKTVCDAVLLLLSIASSINVSVFHTVPKWKVGPASKGTATQFPKFWS
jgi:hypothetical protein